MVEEQEQTGYFVEWGKQQPLVRAMLLTSSRATPAGAADLFSDYDIILILSDIKPFFSERGWLEDFGPVLALYRDPLLQEQDQQTSGYVVQFENGLKIDFTLWPVEMLRRIVAEPALPEEFDAGYRVLLDKDNLTEWLKPPTYKGYIPTPPSESRYLDAVEGFFLDTVYMAKYLWREDMVTATHMLDHFVRHEHLLLMLVWHLETEHHWSVKPRLYGQQLKRWLRPDLWAELESTYTGIDVEANWQALFRIMALYRRAAIEVGERLGYAYPHDLERRTHAYIDRVKALDRQATDFR